MSLAVKIKTVCSEGLTTEYVKLNSGVEEDQFVRVDGKLNILWNQMEKSRIHKNRGSLTDTNIVTLYTRVDGDDGIIKEEEELSNALKVIYQINTFHVNIPSLKLCVWKIL